MSTNLLWTFTLPEVGDPISTQLRNILDVETEIQSLQDKKKLMEDKLKEKILKKWDTKEVREAEHNYISRKVVATDLLKKRGFTNTFIFKAADIWHRTEYSDFYALDFEDQVSYISEYSSKGLLD